MTDLLLVIVLASGSNEMRPTHDQVKASRCSWPLCCAIVCDRVGFGRTVRHGGSRTMPTLVVVIERQSEEGGI